MTYISRRVERNGDKLRVIVDLIIKDVTREVTLGAEMVGLINDSWGNRGAGFSAEATFSRADFGLT